MELPVTTPADPATFDDLCGGLPDHHAEVMTRSCWAPNTAADGTEETTRRQRAHPPEQSWAERN